MQDIFLLGAKCWDRLFLGVLRSAIHITFDESSLLLQSDIVEGSVEQMNDTGSVMTSAEQMNDKQQSQRTVTNNVALTCLPFQQQKISAGVSPALAAYRVSPRGMLHRLLCYALCKLLLARSNSLWGTFSLLVASNTSLFEFQPLSA